MYAKKFLFFLERYTRPTPTSGGGIIRWAGGGEKHKIHYFVATLLVPRLVGNSARGALAARRAERGGGNSV